MSKRKGSAKQYSLLYILFLCKSYILFWRIFLIFIFIIILIIIILFLILVYIFKW